MRCLPLLGPTGEERVCPLTKIAIFVLMKPLIAKTIHWCVAIATIYFGVAFLFLDREWAEIPFAVLLLVILIGSVETMTEKREKDT